MRRLCRRANATGSFVRVIAGTVGGRRLEVPKGKATRPTSDRVREALFSSIGAELPGARVLDLYAGSGALGIEALSRGAREVVFVEDDARTAAVIRRNLETLGLAGGQVRVAEVARYCAAPEGVFDLVLADPPYDTPWQAVQATLGALTRCGALSPGATVIVERRRGNGALPPSESGLAWQRARAYGETVLLRGQAEEDIA